MFNNYIGYINKRHNTRKKINMKNILIAGGTGFLGKYLVSFLVDRGYEVKLLTRNENNAVKNVSSYEWNIEKSFIDKKAFEGVDTIINLTGAAIGEKRWTKKRKQELLDSRLKSINLLYRYVSGNNLPMKTFISSSAVGFYGAVATNEIFTEESAEGNDFLSDICKQWEGAAQQFESIGARVVILRKGVIMGKDSFFYKKTVPLAKLGINPAVGDGNQYIPWIDIRDLVNLYDFIIKYPQIEGVFNAVSSQHLTMNEWAEILLRNFKKRKLTPNVPDFVLKLIFGEMANMFLKGSRVSNRKIKELGFQFSFDKL